MWQIKASSSAFKNVKILEIEPAIKQKYKLFSISGGLIILIGFVFAFPYSFLFKNQIVDAIFMIIGALSSIFYAIINYLLWMMPRRIREYFNKGYRPAHPDDEILTEEEIMKQLKRVD